MQYRVLGKTGLKVSEIGFGGWGIGGGMWGRPDDNESAKALRRAFELGVNFYDTAWVYGDSQTRDGRSEKLIGKFISDVGRNKLVIASKVPPKNFEWPARPNVPISQVFPKSWIINKVNESLERLGIDSIDLMQFHVWDDSFADDSEWQETARELTAQGKVKFWGLSLNNYQPENCRRTIDTGLISGVQLIFNIFHQRPVGMFPFFKKHNVGIIVRVPLDEGGLTGTVNSQTVFAPDDWRRDFFAGERKMEVGRRAEELSKLLDGEAKNLPELALRYILSFNEVSTVIPGMRKESHCLANAAVSDGRKLSPKLLKELKNYAWERNFYGEGT